MILNIEINDKVKIKNREETYKVASLNKSHVRFESIDDKTNNVWIEYTDLNKKVSKC